ncbi:MAG: hypothetical protein KJ042_10605, partial [Deltaproteobacteria bacterium]|nr:hypothetical protein [Deltaproteobacteria bacterium]
STLIWTVCDAEDDLSGGQIFVWITGTQTAALSGDIFWDDFTEGAPSAPDCGAPVDVGIGVDFSALVPFGDDVCVDVEATDSEGNLSNKLENICVFVP